MAALSKGRKGGKAAGIRVEIFKLANHLKRKMGVRFQDQEAGFLTPESIVEADKLIEALCKECPQAISGHLENLSRIWLKMRDMEDCAGRNDLSQQIFTLAHEIKDIGSMCGYDLVAYFAESLRDYIGRTELSIEAQRVIIQAHVDAMQLVNRMGYKKEAGPEAEELKKMVKIAIDKYK